MDSVAMIFFSLSLSTTFMSLLLHVLFPFNHVSAFPTTFLSFFISFEVSFFFYFFFFFFFFFFEDSLPCFGNGTFYKFFEN